MTDVYSIKSRLSKYFTLSDRASRAEFWGLVLSVLLLAPIVGLLDFGVFNTGVYVVASQEGQVQFNIYASGVFTSIFLLFSLIPILATAARRLHDLGKSGFWLFAPLAGILIVVLVSPVIFGIFSVTEGRTTLVTGAPALMLAYSALPLIFSVFALTWWLACPSQPGPNQYGPNPHEVQS